MRRLVTLVIDNPEIDGEGIDVSNDEAILKGDKTVGYVSSGGYAHHVGRSMAMGYVPAEHAGGGTELRVEILGEFFDAEVQSAPVYDPNGGRMRG